MFSKLFQKLRVEGIRKHPQRCFANKFFPKDLCGRFGIIGVPFSKGQTKKGTGSVGLKIAPDMLRKTGFIETLKCLGGDILDYGNIDYTEECDLFLKNMHNLDHFASCAREVAIAAEKGLKEHRRCIILGGDHSLAVGSIYAHLQVAEPKRVALIYVDAHADINTNEISPSGNINGMTVALLAQEMKDMWSEAEIPGLDWMEPMYVNFRDLCSAVSDEQQINHLVCTYSFSLKSVAYIATRSVDPEEAKVLCDKGVAVFGMDDIQKSGIHKILQRALQKIDPGDHKSIHLSFDIDALDTNEAPCTNAPVRGGLTLREGIEIAEYLHRTQRLSIVDLVEVNAAIGTEIQRQITLEAAKNILLAVGGYNRKGNINDTNDEEDEDS